MNDPGIPGLVLGGTPNIPGLVIGKPAAAPSTKYDAKGLAKLWTDAGGKPEDADLMANVALNESSGDPNAKNQYTQDGKTYHVAGLWQISDINGAGDYHDPMVNARKAVEMHRGSGMTPWEDSRTKGGQGGWQKYIDSKQTGHSESDFRHQNDHGIPGLVVGPAFKPSPAPTSVAQQAFEHPAPTGNAASQGMPTALQSQLNAVPRGDKTTSIPGQTAQPVAGSAMKTVMDATMAPASLVTAYAKDLHFQELQKKKLSGKALEDFNAKIKANRDPNPGSFASLFRGAMNADKPIDPDVFPNAAALRKIITGTKGITPEKIAQIAKMTTMVGDGPGSFSDVIQSVTDLGKVHEEKGPLGPVGAGMPNIMPGKAPGKSTPGALAGAKPVLDTIADILPQMASPGGLGVKLATTPVKILADAMKTGALKANDFLKITDAIKSTKAGEIALGKIVNVTNGFQDFGSTFEPVRRAAKNIGQDPDLAENIARSYTGAGKKANDRASKISQAIFADTTRAERVEIERLSENLGPRGIVNPPKLADPHGELMRRAQDLRQNYQDFTNDHIALKLLDDNEVFDPHTYTYRGGGAYKEGEDVHTDLKEFVDAYKSAAQRSSINTQHKVFKTHDDAAPYLKDDYDPADQFIAYASKRGAQAGQERAIQSLHQMGIIKDLEILDPKNPVNILGKGEQGFEAAKRVGARNATAYSAKDAFAKMNDMRAQRGDNPVSWTEFAAMRQAVSAKARTRVRSDMSGQQERAMDRLAGRAQQFATRQEQVIGDELKRQMDSKVQAVDKLREKIDKLHADAQQGDRAAAAKSLSAAVAERDRLELELDQMEQRVQRTAEDVYGHPDDRMPEKQADAYAESRGHFSPEGQKAYGEMLRAPREGQIFEPVVGRLQDIYTLAKDLPPGPERAAVLKSLGQIGKRGVKGPTKITDSVRAGRMLKSIQQAMSHVATAGRDETSMRIIKELNKTADQLTAAITREDIRLYAKKSAVASPSHRAADVALAGSAKAAAAAKKWSDRLDYAIDSVTDVENFERAFSQAMSIRGSGSKQAKNIIKNSELAARNRDRQVSFASVQATGGSPTLEFAKADKGVVNFFKSQGAPPEQAMGIAKFTDGMNRLARIGIITNPVVHAGWNLGTHFLAAGGSPTFFVSHAWEDPHLWGQVGSKTGTEWEAEADKWNAIVHMADTHPLFGGAYGKNMIDQPGEHGWKQAINAGTTALWEQNQRIVFEQLERRYSVALFAHLVDAERMTPQAAGIAVRKALGDYANVSRVGIEGALQRAIMFYPWFKTAIPFWAKTLTTRPGFVALPGAGLRRWDTDMGDPDAETDYPRLTADFGPTETGGRHKMTIPSPVKFVGDIVNALFPKTGEADSIGSRIDAPWKVFQNHLNPWGYRGGGAAGNAVVFGAPVLGTYGPNVKAQQPGGANFNILANRDESTGVQARQIGEHYLGKLPFVDLAEGAVKSIEHPSLAGAAGGYQYDTDSRATQIRNSRALNALDRQIKKATHFAPAAQKAAIAAARRNYENKTGQRAPATAQQTPGIPGLVVKPAQDPGIPGLVLR